MTSKVRCVQESREVLISVDRKVSIKADLTTIDDAVGLVIFIPGTSRGRACSRNHFLAEELNASCFSTLIVELLTEDEIRTDLETGDLRFNIDLLTSRVIAATEWVIAEQIDGYQNIGYYGANTGGAAVICAAAELKNIIRVIVTRSGRCDLAGPEISLLRTPTLFIVAGNDNFTIKVTQNAMQKMFCLNRIEVLEGVGHLFEEPGAIEEVAAITVAWFRDIITSKE